MFGSDESYKAVRPNSRRRVLKPPGGGSSDIFGSAAAEPVEPQRKVKTQLTSSIFADDSATPSRNKAGNSSFYNLFGSEPVTDSSNKSRSNIISDKLNSTEDDNNEESPTDAASTENECLCETNGNELNTESPDCTDSKAETPSPAEAPVVNGNASSTTSAVSSAAPTPTNTAPAPGRQRVPPGGFSSGLW